MALGRGAVRPAVRAGHAAHAGRRHPAGEPRHVAARRPRSASTWPPSRGPSRCSSWWRASPGAGNAVPLIGAPGAGHLHGRVHRHADGGADGAAPSSELQPKLMLGRSGGYMLMSHPGGGGPARAPAGHAAGAVAVGGHGVLVAGGAGAGGGRGPAPDGQREDVQRGRLAAHPHGVRAGLRRLRRARAGAHAGVRGGHLRDAAHLAVGAGRGLRGGVLRRVPAGRAEGEHASCCTRPSWGWCWAPASRRPRVPSASQRMGGVALLLALVRRATCRARWA
jgi:hypothetical protein